MISAVVLAHNDKTILPRCVEGLSWCDEVIVIDDLSTDETMAVAKKLGANVFLHPLRDDFSAQRNFGLTKAKGEWVLFVDSDEVVTPQLAGEIKNFVSMPNDKCQMLNGLYVKRKDYLLGKWLEHGETGNVKLLRLAKKDAGKWQQPVHERWEITGNVGELVHPLLHYPHQNVAQFLAEINRYSTVRAQYLYKNGIQEPTWHILGKPLAKFMYNYFLRLGFLDGTAGFVVALIMSFHSFLVRGKLWHLWQPAS